LLDLVDTPGNLAGSFSEPQLRRGVSKACISFASERIQYWVSDPIKCWIGTDGSLSRSFVLQNS